MAGDNSQEALESAHDYVLTRIEMADHSSDAEYELEEVLYKALRQKEERYVLGFLRWRGSLNLKDITERVISGFVSGLGAGLSFWLLVKLFGGVS